MSPEKPSRNEEEYFAKLEAERLKKMREDAAEAADGVEVDRCHSCGGVWFDAGEVEQVLEQLEAEGAGGLLRSIFRGVRAKAPPTRVKPGNE